MNAVIYGKQNIIKIGKKMKTKHDSVAKRYFLVFRTINILYTQGIFDFRNGETQHTIHVDEGQKFQYINLKKTKTRK